MKRPRGAVAQVPWCRGVKTGGREKKERKAGTGGWEGTSGGTWTERPGNSSQNLLSAAGAATPGWIAGRALSTIASLHGSRVLRRLAKLMTQAGSRWRQATPLPSSAQPYGLGPSSPMLWKKEAHVLSTLRGLALYRSSSSSKYDEEVPSRKLSLSLDRGTGSASPSLSPLD